MNLLDAQIVKVRLDLPDGTYEDRYFGGIVYFYENVQYAELYESDSILSAKEFAKDRLLNHTDRDLLPYEEYETVSISSVYICNYIKEK